MVLKKKLKKSNETKGADSILTRAKPIEDIESHIVMLCYGQAGKGKTVFACTFPKPLLLIDIKEKGFESVIDVPGVDLLEINEWEELEDTYWALEKGTKYQSIVIDQLTAMQALAIGKIRKDNDMDPDEVISQRSWGRVSGLMVTWVDNFRNLVDKYHICLNAHEKLTEPQEEDDDRIAPSVGSNLMKSVASFVNGAVSVIGNAYVREVKLEDKSTQIQFCMRVGPHAYYAAKIRRPVSAGPAPGVIVNPTFEKVLKVSKGESLSVKKTIKRK